MLATCWFGIFCTIVCNNPMDAYKWHTHHGFNCTSTRCTNNLDRYCHSHSHYYNHNSQCDSCTIVCQVTLCTNGFICWIL